jgi:spore coat protein H
MPPRQFVERRTESVRAQLAGERKGYVPAGMGFGFGPPKGAPPGLGNFLGKPLFAALDSGLTGKVSRGDAVAAAKKFFTDCDKDGKGTLDGTQLAAGINRILPRPPGLPAAPPKFGLGDMIAPAIFKRADADKDGKLSMQEFVTAAEALFKEADKNKKGSLDEAGISAALNLLSPPPPAFGPPGFKGFPPKKE